MPHPFALSRGRPGCLRAFVVLGATWLLSACGGGNSAGTPPDAEAARDGAQQVERAQILADAASGFTCAPEALTCVQITSTSEVMQTSVPVTFGQPFRSVDVPVGTALIARDNTGEVPLQVDGVSTRQDGSVRLAVLSAQLRDMQPGETRVLNLFVDERGTPTDTPGLSAAGGYSAPLQGLSIQATLYQPQLSKVVLGNRNGHTPGTPFVEGEQITMSITHGGTTETYPLTITSAMAGGSFTTLTQIALAFHQQINQRSSGLFASVRDGESYETLTVTTRDPGLGSFSVDIQTDSASPIRVDPVATYQSPRLYQVTSSEHRQALQAALDGNLKPHLLGPVAREHTLVLPLRDAQGVVHPQLTARVHTRLLDGGARVRHDLVMENNWAYNPNPGNLKYALSVQLGGQELLAQAPFTHYHHARWRRILWQGEPVQARVRHHMPYVMASGVIWQYNLDLAISEATLAQEATRLAAANTAPMQPGLLTPYFGTTGGRPEIGPYPRWTALYLITQDDRPHETMMTHADLVGGVPIHYRDAVTDQPLDLDRHPGVTVRFGQSAPADALPAITDAATLWSPDIAHQGSFSFVPYVLSGDVYHQDELMFWAAWNMNSYNPGYRGEGQGLLYSEQVRGQAWAMRALGETARALPDGHPMKAYFEQRLSNNLAWYNGHYRAGAGSSPLGAMGNPGGPDNLGPWQQDFFTMAVAQLVQDGYPQAQPLFNWVASFSVGRFLQEADAGLCLANAAAYYVNIKDNAGQYIDTWRALVQENWPGADCSASLPVQGSPSSSAGYAAYARAMLAAAANAGHPQALTTYRRWADFTSSMDPALLQDPTWAVVPLRH